jgi:hypothetical protein
MTNPKEDGQTPASPKSSSHVLPSLNDALGSLQADLERLQSAISHIAQSELAARGAADAGLLVAQTAGGLVGPTTALVDRFDQVDFPSRLDKLDATTSALHVGFQTTQGRLDNVDRGIQEAVRRAEAATAERIMAVQRAADSAHSRLEALVDRFDRVDFPTRLDKLDATASALQVGLQTTQGRLENVDRNIQEVVRRAEAATAERIMAVQRAADSAHSRLEALVDQQAENQAAAMKQLRLLQVGALVGLVAVLVLVAVGK